MSIYDSSNRRFRAQSVSATVYSYIHMLQNNHIDLNPSYQREYVWLKTEQQSFLSTLLSGFPVGFLAIVEKNTDSEMYLECVDGKQRLTTIKLMLEDKITIPIDGKDYLWSELDTPSKRFIGNISLPYYEFKVHNGQYDLLEKEKIDYFIAVNFGGVPQSEEHKYKVLKLRAELDNE